MQKKTICIVSTNADLAGAPLHVLNIVEQLRQNYNFICIFGEHGFVEHKLNSIGIETYVVPKLRSKISPVKDLKCYFTILRLLEKISPDLVHAHSAKAGMLSRIAANKLRIPCLYTVHGWGFGPGRKKIQGALLNLTERYLALTTKSRIIFVSKKDRQQASSIGIADKCCVVIPNGISDHNFQSNPEKNSGLIMVARAAYPKDYATLLKAFEHCLLPSLTMVGFGTDQAGMKDLIYKHAPTRSENIKALGNCVDIPNLLAAAGVFVLSSRHEALPLSIIEAMCAGLPIVATNVGGIPELVEHNKNGFLIPPGDSNSLALALNKLNNNELRMKMGQSSREKFQTSFSNKKMLNSLNAEYLTAKFNS